ncbi:RluA family pseudouridine synthase [Columbia Basin potato purple top phytoplasma]|uniref:Pseudouridine synthase n=1 Tax=Columbia Basin potato purple top phytoplasma TaxID=307134 RepID=A0ABT5L8M1_9MOLU|nr:RluA family pseudouridine synthase [Columbia Basin potato purple top phytoplasma]MDC9031994.1 RluA family pseudouridine synthase [Columbia Basin potato purple top phytoplasma]
MKIFVVHDKEQNIRLDLFLTQKLNISRNYCYSLINSGQIIINNNKVLKKSYLLKINDVIQVPSIINNESSSNIIDPINLNLKVIYEDQYLAIIDKPYNLIVHPSPSYSGITLINGLFYQIKDFKFEKNNMRPGIVHRLDKDTTGLLIIGKTEESVLKIQNLIRKREVQRIYWALINGCLKYDHGVIDLPIKRNESNRLKMEVSRQGKSSVTHFKLLKKFKNFSLLELKLETGRMHQIRVHLSYLGYPICGDCLYSTKKQLIQKQLLHSKKLKFIHPFTQKKLQFEIPLPFHFQNFLNEIELN